MKASSITYLSKNINVFAVFFVSVYLLLNIASSLLVSPIYFGLINEQKEAVIMYLQKILPFPYYNSELLSYQKVYGTGIENEVIKEKLRRDSLIKRLEQLLEKNPKERDLLYSLYLLKKESGDDKKADEYSSRSKEIDPVMKSPNDKIQITNQ